MNMSRKTSLLRPEVLQQLSSLDLIARSAIDGFLIGMHRSLKHGFSQEFAEYRSYQEGDDPRFIDWNVFARTERMVLKQFWGETNTHLTLLVDASASMGFSTGSVSKYQYSSWLAALLAYLAKRQQDAIGLLLFSDDVMEFRPPSARSEALHSVLHILEQAKPGRGTSMGQPVRNYCDRINRPGIIAVISDFLDHPEKILDELKPLHGRGQDVILFQVLDPGEIKLQLKQGARLQDMETGSAVNIDADFAATEYSDLMQQHIQGIRDVAKSTGAEHVLLQTDQPLDMALKEYLLHRQRRV